jgi:hypothetical protein
MSKIKVSIIIFGVFVFFYLYKLFALPSDPSYGGFYDLRSIGPWIAAWLRSLWLLPFVFLAFLLVMVLGVDRFFGLIRPFLFVLRREEDSEPIESQRGEQSASNIQIPNDAGIGYTLYLDYHDSVKRAYYHTIMQYSRSFNFSLLFAVIGFGLIFYALIFKTDASPNWPSVFVSAVIQSVPALFFYLSDRARRQMTQVFADLRRDNEVARAYELLHTIKDDEKRENLKMEIVRHTLLVAQHRSSTINQPADNESRMANA